MSSFQPNRPGGYLIRLKANPDLVLANVDGKARLAWRNIDDLSQLWTINAMTTGTKNFQLINFSNGSPLRVAGYGDGLVFGGESKGWNIPGGIATDNFQALRPADNFDWNLNALGNGPYDIGTQVGVWDWTCGAGNEMWQITYFPANPSTAEWRLICNYPRGLAVQEGDTNGTLPLICDGTASYPQKNERLVFAKIDWTLGFALRSKYNGKFVYWKGVNQPLGQSDTMSIRTLWTFAGRKEDGYGAIRPVWILIKTSTFLVPQKIISGQRLAPGNGVVALAMKCGQLCWHTVEPTTGCRLRIAGEFPLLPLREVTEQEPW